MARGFESKDVEFQQAEAERRAPSGPALTADERERASRRQTLMLALAKARADRAAARSARHRHMLDTAIAELETELRQIADTSKG